MFNLHSQHWGYRLAKLALVNILSNLMIPLAGLCDTAFLGHLADIRYLAGVALATVLFNWIYWTFGFLRMGTTGTTAQAAGQGSSDQVLLILLRHSLMALSLGGFVLLCQIPLREIGFTLLHATPEVKASGQAYYNALIWGAPATLLNLVLMGWFLGRQQGAKVLLLSGVNNGTNIALNYLLIVQWGWASFGAGCATAISQYLMTIIGLILVYQEGWFRKSKAIASQILDPIALQATLSLNGDITIRTFAIVLTFSCFTNLSATMGTQVLATNTLLLQAITLTSYFIDGLAFATESLAGSFRGQAQHHLLFPLLKVAGGISLALGLTFASIYVLLPQTVFSLLTNHPEVIIQVNQSVLWLVPVLGFGAIAYFLDGYFLGLTEGRILRNSMVLSAIAFAPLAVLAWYWQNVQMLWFAMTCFMAARALTLGLQVPKTIHQLSRF